MKNFQSLKEVLANQYELYKLGDKEAILNMAHLYFIDINPNDLDECSIEKYYDFNNLLEINDKKSETYYTAKLEPYTFPSQRYISRIEEIGHDDNISIVRKSSNVPISEKLIIQKDGYELIYERIHSTIVPDTIISSKITCIEYEMEKVDGREVLKRVPVYEVETGRVNLRKTTDTSEPSKTLFIEEFNRVSDIHTIREAIKKDDTYFNLMKQTIESTKNEKEAPKELKKSNK